MSFASFFVALLGLAYIIGTLSDDKPSNLSDGSKGSIAGDGLYTVGCGVSSQD